MQVPLSDWLFGILFLAGMIALLAVAERIYRVYPASAESLRKLVHIATGAAVLPTPLLFTSWLPIFMITILFALLNLWSIYRGRLNSIHRISRPSLGTVYYPFSFAALVLLFWNRNFMVLSISFALMAFADAFAGIVASNVAQRKILPLPWDEKSAQGSGAMFASSTLIVGAGLIIFRQSHDLSLGIGAIVALAIGLLATAAEALSYRGSDNLSVPLLSALGLYVVMRPDMQLHFLLGEGLALGITLAAFAAKALDISGTMAAFLIGTLVFGIGAWPFALPLLLFFIGSSILSRLSKHSAKLAQEIIAKGARRDAGQVLANGILPALVVIGSLWLKKEAAFLLYLGGIAAVTADTWATEIGLALGRKPRSIVTGKLVAPGTSGGITLAGVAGACLGAALIAFAGWWSYKSFAHVEIPWTLFIRVAIAGVLAHFIDSLLGATVQRENRCVICQKITERKEHCRQPTGYDSGLRWLDNDMVNLACGLSGISLAAIVNAIFFK